MQLEVSIHVGVTDSTGTEERRRSGRLYKPFPTRVRGVAPGGKTFSVETVLDNISAGGLYLKLPVEVEHGRTVRAVVCFQQSDVEPGSSPRLWIKGEVVRSEPQPDGGYGIAVALESYRFL